MGTNIRQGSRDWSRNLWDRVKALFSGLDTRVTALEQGGGGGGGAVSGVKGDSESTYRTGNVNLTPANIGAKATQSAVSDPTASGTGLTFIDSITQDAQGVITPTKKTVQTATQSADGLISSTDKAKLDGIASGAQVNSITGVKGDAESTYRTGNVSLTPANIGAAPGNLMNGTGKTFTFNVANGFRGAVIFMGGAASYNCVYLVAVSGGGTSIGTVYVNEITKGANLTVSTSTNTFVITSSASITGRALWINLIPTINYPAMTVSST